MLSEINGAVPLYFWSKHNNFGDQMSKDILEFAIGKKVTAVSESYRGKFLVIGSVLDKYRKGDVVWGTGVHPRFYHEGNKINRVFNSLIARRKFDYSAAKILAVRGPITRQYIIQNGGAAVDVLGDPAVLAPMIYSQLHRPERRFLLINHFSVPFCHSINIPIAGATMEWRRIVDEICKSEIVISSSLHGLILAEAYGVPAIFLRNSAEGLIKYLDYYGATGRFPFIANTIEDALNKKNITAPPSCEAMAIGLINALEKWKVKI